MLYWDSFINQDSGRTSKECKCSNCNIIIKKNSYKKAWVTNYDKITGETNKVAKKVPSLICYYQNGNKHFKKPDSYDLDNLKKIEDFEIENFFPVDEFPEGFNTKQPKNSDGIRYTHQMYTKRNLIVAARLQAEFKKYPPSYWSTFNTIWHATKMRRYNARGGHRPLTGTLYVPPCISEGNMLKVHKRKIKQISRFLKYINGFQYGDFAIYTGDATNTNLNKNSVDYVFTDPPFGSNLMYSELNYLWESWLRIKTNNTNEAIENNVQGKTLSDYHHLMHLCFKEYFRVLKPGKWMTVVFSNTSASVWNGIQNAIQNAGFVIARVDGLDKKQGSFKAVTTVTAVKQDLVISCYKPSEEFISKFGESNNKDIAVWDFLEEHLNHLPIHLQKNNSTTAIIERSPKILFDRLIAFYVQRGNPVPMSASKFQKGLRERFIERDGMFFTNEQVQEYDRKKAEVPNFTQLSILVASEQDGVLWLQNFLKNDPKTYQDIQPEWMQALGGERKGDIIPELKTILEENFLKNDAGEWYVPDPDKEEDLEKLRNRRLLKQFEEYKEQAFKPKGKIKECRVEALRAGFKQSYQDKDFETIVRVGDRIPNNLLMEDEVLLQFYDIAAAKV